MNCSCVSRASSDDLVRPVLGPLRRHLRLLVPARTRADGAEQRDLAEFVTSCVVGGRAVMRRVACMRHASDGSSRGRQPLRRRAITLHDLRVHRDPNRDLSLERIASHDGQQQPTRLQGEVPPRRHRAGPRDRQRRWAACRSTTCTVRQARSRRRTAQAQPAQRKGTAQAGGSSRSTQDDVFVDFGGKSQGIAPLAQFDERAEGRRGDGVPRRALRRARRAAHPHAQGRGGART